MNVILKINKYFCKIEYFPSVETNEGVFDNLHPISYTCSPFY